MKNSKFKVIGTNAATQHLEGEILDLPSEILHFCGGISTAEIKDKLYTFEVKLTRFVNCESILEGFVVCQDGTSGRISLKYLPE